MNEVVNPLHGISVSYCISYELLLLFSKVLPPSKLANSVVLLYRGYRDCIVFAVYFNWQAKMDIMLPKPMLDLII